MALIYAGPDWLWMLPAACLSPQVHLEEKFSDLELTVENNEFFASSFA